VHFATLAGSHPRVQREEPRVLYTWKSIETKNEKSTTAFAVDHHEKSLKPSETKTMQKIEKEKDRIAAHPWIFQVHQFRESWSKFVAMLISMSTRQSVVRPRFGRCDRNPQGE